MDKFEKRYGKKPKMLGTMYEMTEKAMWHIRKQAWQESAKQMSAQIAYLKEIIENLEMSVRSFTDNMERNVDIAERERKRIVDDLPEVCDEIALHIIVKMGKFPSQKGMRASINRILAAHIEKDK